MTTTKKIPGKRIRGTPIHVEHRRIKTKMTDKQKAAEKARQQRRYAAEKELKKAKQRRYYRNLSVEQRERLQKMQRGYRERRATVNRSMYPSQELIDSVFAAFNQLTQMSADMALQFLYELLDTFRQTPFPDPAAALARIQELIAMNVPPIPIPDEMQLSFPDPLPLPPPLFSL